MLMFAHQSPINDALLILIIANKQIEDVMFTLIFGVLHAPELN